MPDEFVGDHLSDEEFVDYSMKILPEEHMQRVDEHLTSCPECTGQMEQLLDVSEAWEGKQGRQRLIALRQRILANIPIPSIKKEL